MSSPNIGYSALTIIPSLRGMDAKMRSELTGVSSEFERAGRNAGQKYGTGVDSALNRHSQKLTVAGKKMTRAVSAPLLALGGLAVKAASDLAESQSKVDVVFGDSANEIQKWSKSAAKSLGQSQESALSAAGTFGNLFVALKIGQKPAADMSRKMVELASDLASFNNVSPEEALNALRSGLVGETEPLRKFGVNMNDATLRAEALKQGLVDNVRDGLSPAAKAQAAYGLILEQTSVAQGDFARTADGAANRSRILRAQFQDTAATLGTQLLPHAERALAWASRMTSEFNNMSPAAQGVAIKLGAVAVAAGPAVNLVGNLGKAAQGAGKLMTIAAANPLAAATIGLGIAVAATWNNFSGAEGAVRRYSDALKGAVVAGDKLLGAKHDEKSAKLFVKEAKNSVALAKTAFKDLEKQGITDGPQHKAARLAIKRAEHELENAILRREAAYETVSAALADKTKADKLKVEELGNAFLETANLSGAAMGRTVHLMAADIAKTFLPAFTKAGGKAEDLNGVLDSLPELLRIKVETAFDLALSATVRGGMAVAASGNIRADFRAHGGPVEAGHPYIVGERRPELFVPDTDGTILPRVPSGTGASGISWTGDLIVEGVGDPDAVADRVIRRIGEQAARLVKTGQR